MRCKVVAKLNLLLFCRSGNRIYLPSEMDLAWYSIVSIFCVIIAGTTVSSQPSKVQDTPGKSFDERPRSRIMSYYCPIDYECDSACGEYTRSSSTCSCHPACTIFQDCCYDTQERQKLCPKGNETDNFITEVQTLQSYFQCTRDVISEERYWMIGKCPESWTGLNKCDISLNDSDIIVGNFEDDWSGLPVLDGNGLPYRNIYCALCHGTDLSDLSSWSLVSKDCKNSTIFGEESRLTLKEKVLFLTKTCSDVTFLPPADHSHYLLSLIPCREITLDVIDSCGNETFENDIAKRCSEITAPISVGGLDFKNTFCVDCYYSGYENVDVELNEACTAGREEGNFQPIAPPGPVPCIQDFTGTIICFTPAPPPPLVPISITFNFGDQKSGVSIYSQGEQLQTMSVRCREGQVFDPFDGKCRQLSCPEGYQLQDTSCEELSRNYTRSTTSCDRVIVELFIGTRNRSPVDDCLAQIRNYSDCIPQHLHELLKLSMDSPNLTCSNTEAGKLYLFQTMETSDHAMELRSGPETNGKDSFTFPNRCVFLDSISITTQCASSTFYPKNATCDDNWLDNTQWTFEDNFTSGISFANSSKKVQFIQVKIRHSFSNFSSKDNTWSNEDVQVKRCDQEQNSLSTCTLLVLDSSLFVSPDNDSSLIIYTPNTSVRFPRDMYTILPTGQIQVCSFLQSTGVFTYTFLPTYSFAQSVVSTVGISLSIICLSLTLLTYCVFPSLRTVIANILVMTFCAFLILAQVCLLLAGVAASHEIICSVISGIGHLFWLTTFSTSSVLGFVMSQTFSLRNQTIRNTGLTRQSLIYLLPCFGLPIVISGVLLLLFLLDSTRENFQITYGTISGCWIGGTDVNLYAFGIPVGISLLVNVVFFLHITVSICVQKRGSKNIRKNTDESQLRDLLIYIKIFIILGLTWISGFLAVLVNQSWLWYMFIVFTSLQGVFIFLAFTVKSQIWQMWGKRLGLIKSDRKITVSCRDGDYQHCSSQQAASSKV